MAAIRSYNFAQVDLIIGGVRIAGYGDDGGISIEPTSDSYIGTVGADGEGTVSTTNDKSATCTITLKETSVSNSALHVLMLAQESLSFANPFLMSDPRTGEKVASQQCVVMAVPTRSKTREAGEREWKVWLPSHESTFPEDIF